MNVASKFNAGGVGNTVSYLDKKQKHLTYHKNNIILWEFVQKMWHNYKYNKKFFLYFCWRTDF